MQRNVGSWDRWLRAVIGLALVGGAATWGAPLRWLGLGVGAVLLVTAAAGYCPLYGVCRISTAPKAAREDR